MFTQPEALVTLRNTIIWVILVPTVSTVIGLAYAVFIDRSRGEKIYKSLIFMPFAHLVRRRRHHLEVRLRVPPGGPRPDRPPQPDPRLVRPGAACSGCRPARLNTILLIIVMIWVQTGFAVVVLSASIKGIPTEQLEAAELDGTNGWQRFTNVVLPGIRGALVVVVTTISIATLKVFDIVRTMTGGNFETSVVANEMYTQAFRALEPGRGSALALILFVLVLPIVVYNVRVLRKQKEIR